LFIRLFCHICIAIQCACLQNLIHSLVLPHLHRNSMCMLAKPRSFACFATSTSQFIVHACKTLFVHLFCHICIAIQCACLQNAVCSLA
jgi:hypothetical protein